MLKALKTYLYGTAWKPTPQSLTWKARIPPRVQPIKRLKALLTLNPMWHGDKATWGIFSYLPPRLKLALATLRLAVRLQHSPHMRGIYLRGGLQALSGLAASNGTPLPVKKTAPEFWRNVALSPYYLIRLRLTSVRARRAKANAPIG